MIFRLSVLLWLVFNASLATVSLAQVLPPDESLTDGLQTKRSGDPDTTSLLNRETITAASPSKVRGKGIDSSYVDTLGVGFFKKVFAKTYPQSRARGGDEPDRPGRGADLQQTLCLHQGADHLRWVRALIYSGEYNRKLKNRYKEAYRLKLQGLTTEFVNKTVDTPQRLSTRRDELDKNFQLSYIGVGILHLVQVLEAYTTRPPT